MERSWPQAVIVPAVGAVRPTSIFATVVLPEPDSPTMASEPPAGTARSTPSTATTSPYSLRRPVASSTASGTRHLLHQPPAQLLPAHAAHLAPAHRPQRR